MIRLLAALVMAAAAAAAQAPEPFAWWNSPLAANLNLTADQQRQIRAIVREYREPLIEKRAAVQVAEGRLQDAMNEDPVSEGRAKEAIEGVVAARGDLMRAVSTMALRMRMVLTAGQWQRVQQRRAAQAVQRRQERLQQRGGRLAQPAPAPRAPVY
jgi:Spy/CpxP family protein refolding chaperone